MNHSAYSYDNALAQGLTAIRQDSYIAFQAQNPESFRVQLYRALNRAEANNLNTKEGVFSKEEVTEMHEDLRIRVAGNLVYICHKTFNPKCRDIVEATHKPVGSIKALSNCTLEDLVTVSQIMAKKFMGKIKLPEHIDLKELATRVKETTSGHNSVSDGHLTINPDLDVLMKGKAHRSI